MKLIGIHKKVKEYLKLFEQFLILIKIRYLHGTEYYVPRKSMSFYTWKISNDHAQENGNIKTSSSFGEIVAHRYRRQKYRDYRNKAVSRYIDWRYAIILGGRISRNIAKSAAMHFFAFRRRLTDGHASPC